ncbi:hypothetical protein VPNG_03914 [Cytospora leucostoma]|uniref:Stress-activated map kinase-interacting protein n=1 Tax=Cytospora leucostoma TaxID=1230097 RepID=A0A423XE91_9PEZI|nr:hypothetical protein VPNG_03914 [Cytospora leucostoma]
MSVIQVEDLVSYQLRASYLTEVADGVGERLITLNENFLNSAPFKAAGWRTNPALIKRTHSPPIPTAVASDYFQAPRQVGVNLEDEPEEGGMLTGGGNDTYGPGAATKRRRRREQMEEEDSSDLSDESEDEQDQRAAQQIKFAKMPVRNRSGSSPIQSSSLRQTTSASSPRAPPRRGSQSALEVVKERARRDTVTSSEVSSENELEAAGYPRQREAARAAAKAVRIQTNLNKTEPSLPVIRQQSDLLQEERDDDDDDDSDASDMSSAFNESIESASMLAGDLEKQLANISPTHPLIGTPPRDFKRQSTIRKSMPPPPQVVGGELPPRRPTSTIRPTSMIQPKSLISEALNAKKTKPAAPFESFATLSGKGEASPLMIRIYAPSCNTPSKPYEVLIRRTVHEENAGDRPVHVADLIGLALWRYNDEGLEPPLPADKLNVNWWTLKMVEEGGEVDDDFPPLERTKPVISFATAASNKNEGMRPMAVMPRFGRGRSNTKIYDDFALVPATEDEFEANKAMTPQFTEEAVADDIKEEMPSETPQPDTSVLAAASYKPTTARYNPVLTTTYRPDANMLDAPQTQTSRNNTQRGQHKSLHIHIMTPDAPAGEILSLDVTTDMYIEEVLELVCRKRNLDKNIHILKIPNSGAIALLDRPVSAIGTMQDLELHRRRFGDPTLSQSPAGHSPGGRLLFSELGVGGKKSSKIKGIHPLAKEALAQEELSRDNHYRRYVVYRKQTMRFAGLNERLFAIEGEYIHIAPSSGGKPLTDSNSKTTTVHFSNVVGCKLSRRHPSHFKFVIYRDGESKRYDFETKSAEEAEEIVTAIKHGTPTA